MWNYPSGWILKNETDILSKLKYFGCGTDVMSWKS